MKELIISTGETILLDDEDFERISKFKWLKRNQWIYRYSSYRNRTLANEIIKIKGLIDHKDRNPLNNQKCNLRLANKSLNGANRAKQNTVCASKYKGVSLNKGGKTWRARIKHWDRLIVIGTFKTEVEAAVAYNKKAIELFGEFAHLNEVSVS